jgi:hypothetical protein
MALAVGLLFVPRDSQATTSLSSLSTSCFSGACEFSPTLFGPGAATSIDRTINQELDPGFLGLQNHAAMTVVNYDRFATNVQSTGALQDYPSGTPGTTGPNNNANARAIISDAVNVSGATGVGTMRLSWRLTGGVDVGWSITGPVSDIDHAQVRFTIGCTANTNPPTLPGCGAATTRAWNGPTTVDEIFNVDIPIRFDSTVQYILTATAQSATGTGVITGDGLISMQAHALGSFGSTGTLVAVQILDAGGQLVSGSTIQSESGFRYDLVVPEPNQLPLLAVGVLTLLAARRR